MRVIRFRAKPYDSDNWIYGSSPVKFGKAWAMLVTDDAGRLSVRLVRPETVSQGTGADASDGQPIYGGDIITGGYCTDVESIDRVVVYWNNMSFQADDRPLPEGHATEVSQDFKFWKAHHVDIKVIGNLTDNPELLPTA